jgi:hypothetical protein
MDNKMKTATFNEVKIGNKFLSKKEWFVKMNTTQAIGNDGILKQFNASQYVTIAIEKDRSMCA